MSDVLHTTEAWIQAEQLQILQSLGWTFTSRKAMNELRGQAGMNESIVESLLVDAIIRLNKGLDQETARYIAAQVRRVSSDREMLEVLRDGYPYKPAPDEPTRNILVVDASDPSRNSYVLTEEFVIRTGGQREPRLDVVCLVNGIPLSVIENKDTDEPVDAAADDWRGYWHDAPQLVAQVAVVGCCNGIEFRTGPSGLEDVDGYHQWRDVWPHEVEDADDEMLVSLTGAFHPHTVVDLATNFIVFETRAGVTAKKLARAHQYRAANKLVQRVVEGEMSRGIVWHATGSGKSLTMVFAAGRLMRAGLGNPSVLLVVDRTDLDEQINETLLACEFDGVQQATSGNTLERLLSSGTGGVSVTTAQKFRQGMKSTPKGHPVIVFVDEAHRTQFGKFGIWMRDAVPEASLFGFTGTPIELDQRSTRQAFSPKLTDGTYEAYLDRYGFDQSIADGATVPVVYEPRLAEWRITKLDLDEKVAELTEEVSEEQREAIKEQAARERVIAKAPKRVAAVIEDVYEQISRRFAPNGMSAQLVCVDRAACALAAEELSKYFQPEEFATIMSRSKKDSALREGDIDIRRWYPAAHWERVHTTPPPTGDDNGESEESADEAGGFVVSTDRAAIRDFISRFKDPNDPLKVLVVNGMLLTGFDAPGEQAMFLDRPLRGHTLMQAIARTNRRYPGKDFGVILDYWGVFDELQDALAEFAAEDLRGLVEPTDELITRFPKLLDDALAIVAGAPPGSPRRRMLWVVRLLINNAQKAEEFERLFRETQSIYETLAPDPRLAPYVKRYAELLEVWASWRRGTRRDQRGGYDLRQKTRKLVQEAIGMERIRTDLPAHTIDADFLHALAGEAELNPEEKATDIEAAVVHEIKVRGEDDPLAKTLAERLAELRAQRGKAAQMTIEGLRDWERMVADYFSERQYGAVLGLDEAGTLVNALLNRAAPTADENDTVAVARTMSERYAEVARIPDWVERPDIAQDLRREAVRALVANPSTRQLPQDPQVVDDILAALGTLSRSGA